MQTFSEYNFHNQKALVRVDFNVPLNKKFEITDDTRMVAVIPTLKKILTDGGSVILMSHLGRPKDGSSAEFSLLHLLKHLQSLLDKEKIACEPEVFFASDCISEEAIEKVKYLENGSVLLLENLRFYKEEEKGDEAFAKKLSQLGDVYVNDAFGTAHRAHASTAIMAKYFSPEKKMFGALMEAEVLNAEKVLLKSEKPFTAIIGGAKVSDKILILENLLDRANNIIVGGGMAYTFLKAMGYAIGKSLCENDKIELAKTLLEKAKQKGVTFLLPVDSIAADNFSNDAVFKNVSNEEGIPDDYMGLDIGTKSIELFTTTILGSKTILWNGPMGVFEMSNFQKGTRLVAEAVAEATQKQRAFSLIGGGDSVAAINQFRLSKHVSYISTGGGAMLEFFEGKILPGVAAIQKK